MKQIIVGIADMKVGSGNDEIVTYALGSCIGVCMYDEIVQTGGMLHVMLPKSGLHTGFADTSRYVDSGIVHLYRVLCRRGAGIGRIKAKIIGGARMFEFDMANRATADIGTLNVKEAKQYLMQLGVPITAEMTGGYTGRTVYFTAGTGEVKIRTTENQKFVI
ncbi:MAG: chemotaxis protein CheD [Lachnospiraceae bacterium]|nr:chemotaxis protein CheD [Lachnospiraceae bacterium]